MIKETSFFPRRPDLTVVQFRLHYETQHVPLALRHYRTFAKYTRNHVLCRRLDALPFDCMTEMWYRNLSEFQAGWEYYASPEGEEVITDELRFMDRPNIVSLQTDESLVHGSERHEELQPVAKVVLLLSRESGATRELFSERVSGACREAVDRVQPARLTVDLPIEAMDVPEVDIKAKPSLDAIVSIWPTDPPPSAVELEADSAYRIIGSAVVEQVETPENLLHDW